MNAILTAADETAPRRRRAIVNLTAKAIQDYPDQLQIIKAMSEQAMAGDWDTSRYELELLRATRPTVSGRGRTQTDDGLSGNVIEAALCLGGGIEDPEKHFKEPVLEAAAKRWSHGLGLGEMLQLFARRNGNPNVSNRNIAALLKAAFSEEGRVPACRRHQHAEPARHSLSNVANKFLRLGFESVEQTWKSIASVKPVKDFKQNSSYTLTGDFEYQEVAPGGELKHAVPGEQTYTNQAKTYGRLFAIDRRDIINDDLAALTTAPRRLGRGGATKFNLVFWTEFLNNAAFFTAGTNNYAAGVTPGPTTDSRLNIDGLTNAETLFLNQTDPDGKPLGSTPTILLVPNALNAPASALMRSTELRDTTASTKYPVSNPHAGKFTPVRSSYLSNITIAGYSTSAWYLLCDPMDISTIEVAFLNGVDTPIVESASADFDILGIAMRGYHDFGVAKQEFRAGVKMAGA